jgi:hypothetical protein
MVQLELFWAEQLTGIVSARGIRRAPPTCDFKPLFGRARQGLVFSGKN